MPPRSPTSRSLDPLTATVPYDGDGRDEITKLEALRRFSDAVADSTMQEEILGTLLIHGMDALGANRGAILRHGPNGAQALLGRQDGLITWGAGPFVSESLVRFSLESGQAYVQVHASAETGEPEGSRAIICMPLETEPDFLVFYADRPAAAGATFGLGQVWMLQSLAQFGRVAMSNARMIEQANERNEMLQTLNRTSLLVSSSLDAERILAHLLDQVLRLTSGEVALALGTQDRDLVILAARGPEAVEPTYLRHVVDTVVETGEALCVTDGEGSGDSSIMCVPLAVQNQLLGVLYVSSRLSVRNFRDSDLAMMQAMGNHAALAIHNARQFVQVHQKRLIEAELAIAHTIQQSFFPKQVPQVGGLKVVGACEAAQEVGGDYFDIIPLANGQVAITLGDVSGKGIAASLYMAVVRTALRMALRYGQTPREVLVEVNSRIHDDIKDGSFITCFLGVYDAASGTFTYASAGQNLGVWVTGTGMHDLAGRGLPLGLDPKHFETALESHQIQLSAGDRIALFTDGVIEALSPTDEEFGEDRFKERLLASGTLPIEDALASLMGAIREHVDVASPWDDMTLLLAEVDAVGPLVGKE
ncbi:MAG: protein serine phosphatase [Cyanobacteria bacterium RYN_339]|nr:protein serine phosphatase [Cyanobacteria bacterium RYN_339]